MESHTPMKQTLFCYGIIETFTQDLGGHTHSLLDSRVALDLNAVGPGIPHVVLATQLNNVCRCLSPYPHPLLLPELQLPPVPLLQSSLLRPFFTLVTRDISLNSSPDYITPPFPA